MKRRAEIQPICSPGGDFPEWISAHFRTRAYLANEKSEFRCDPACTRPGCRGMVVPVTLVDVLGAALYHDESVSAIYRGNYSLGLLSGEKREWVRVVSLRLKNPCPFLEKDLCSIYPARPLPCILFPESLVLDGTLDEYARHKRFRDYLCLRHPIPLSRERAEIVKSLRKMWRREWLVSSFHLFYCCPFSIDLSNFREELLQASRELECRGPEGKQEPIRAIPNQAIEHFFQTRIAMHEPFVDVAAKIHDLDKREGQERLFQLLQDDALVQELSRDERVYVFRLVNGRLKVA